MKIKELLSISDTYGIIINEDGSAESVHKNNNKYDFSDIIIEHNNLDKINKLKETTKEKYDKLKTNIIENLIASVFGLIVTATMTFLGLNFLFSLGAFYGFIKWYEIVSGIIKNGIGGCTTIGLSLLLLGRKKELDYLNKEAEDLQKKITNMEQETEFNISPLPEVDDNNNIYSYSFTPLNNNLISSNSMTHTRTR